MDAAAVAVVPKRSLCTYTLPSGGYFRQNATDCISNPPPPHLADVRNPWEILTVRTWPDAVSVSGR